MTYEEAREGLTIRERMRENKSRNEPERGGNKRQREMRDTLRITNTHLTTLQHCMQHNKLSPVPPHCLFHHTYVIRLWTLSDYSTIGVIWCLHHHRAVCNLCPMIPIFI